jgi:AcrR family transcriptional regulator
LKNEGDTMPRQRFNRLPADKQEMLLETAGREFAAHGYEGASLNRILQAAGVSKGSAYYYFDDKADLYLAVFQHYRDHILSQAVLELAPLDAEHFWSALADIYRALLAHILERPWILQLAWSLFKLPPETRSTGQLGQVYAMWRGWFGALLAKGRELGVIVTDLPDDLVITLLMAVDEAYASWLVAHFDELAEPEREALDLRLSSLHLMRKMLAPEEPCSPPGDHRS